MTDDENQLPIIDTEQDDDDSPAMTERRAAKEARLRESAVAMLKRGMSKEKLTIELNKRENISMNRAKAIAEDVWEEHIGIRRTNIIILFGVSGVLILIGVAIAVLGENLPVGVVPAGFGGLLAWNAFQQLRAL